MSAENENHQTAESDDRTPSSADRANRQPLRSRPAAMMFSVAAVVGIWLLWDQMTVTPPNGSPAAESDAAERKDPSGNPSALESLSARDERFRELIVGHWKTDRDGERDLIVRPDGTATMDVTISSWHRVMFGERIVFYANWTIEDGFIGFETTGGKPATAVKAVSKMYGAAQRYEIIDITEQQIRLKDDEEGEPDHIYERLPG